MKIVIDKEVKEFNNINEFSKINVEKETALKVIRMLIFFAVSLILIVVAIKYTPFIIGLLDSKNMDTFIKDINSMGFLGILAILGLQVLQIVVAVIPGQPIELLTGVMYGPLGAVIICTIGAFIGTALVFFAVRKIGTDFIELFFSKEQINEIKNTRVFRNPAKFEFLMFIIFLIPAIPKDIFIYLGGLSPVRPKRFLFISTLARIPGLLIISFAGNELKNGNFDIPIVLLVAVILIAGVGYQIVKQKKAEFEKQEEDAEKSNKTI